MKSKLLILVAVVGLFAGYVIAAEQETIKMGDAMEAAVAEGTDAAMDMGEAVNAVAEEAAVETEAAVEAVEESMNSMLDKAVEGEVAK